MTAVEKPTGYFPDSLWKGSSRKFATCHWCPLVALVVARVSELSARRRQEPPLVALRAEGELQHAVGVVVVDLAVGKGVKDLVVVLATGAHHELPDAPLGVRFPVRILRCEAFVVVVVSGEDHVRSRFVEDLPQRLQLGGAAVLFPGAEVRVVKVGQGAPPVVVGGEVCLKPAKRGD